MVERWWEGGAFSQTEGNCRSGTCSSAPDYGTKEAAMHWRKVPSRSNGKVFYGVVLALTALVALSTALLVLHFPA
jgi:hypothetical protein